MAVVIYTQSSGLLNLFKLGSVINCLLFLNLLITTKSPDVRGEVNRPRSWNFLNFKDSLTRNL